MRPLTRTQWALLESKPLKVKKLVPGRRLVPTLVDGGDTQPPTEAELRLMWGDR